MNKLTLLISLCIFSSASWSNCIGDCVNGYGTQTWPDGDKYVGEWIKNKRNGRGTATLADGEKYVGQWKDGKRNGQGAVTYSNGNIYSGDWKDDQKNGQGTFTFADGNKYVGQIKDDRRSGEGVDFLIDGRQINYRSNRIELIGANGQTLRRNVQNNELDAIRRESVENKGRYDEILAKRQQEKDRLVAIQQRQNKKLIVGIQRQLIEYQYLRGIADGIAGRNTSIALERFYRDTEIIRPSLDDYTTITEGSCSNNSVDQSKYTVCFDIAM